MKSSYYKPEQVGQLPSYPGIYKFYNKENTLIYVGKAKHLRNRVKSYFAKTVKGAKTQKMVKEIIRLEITIVNSEFDALLLENALIKENQPKYNILLKDDKTYPYILVTKENFPRLIKTREVDTKRGTYYGPYANVGAMNVVYKLLRSIYPIRNCKYNLSEENIKAGKVNLCLEYHIGNCLGPCEGLQEAVDYEKDIEQAEHILKGNLAPIKRLFKKEMQAAAAALAFEKAQDYKERLNLLEAFQANSEIVNIKIATLDVFTIVADDKTAFINYLKIQHGNIILTKTVEVKKNLEEDDEHVLSLIVLELRERYSSTSKELISNINLPDFLEEIESSVPQRGDKRKLIELSVRNALFYKKEKLAHKPDKANRSLRVLTTLQKDLEIDVLPEHIECFDNSNLQGTDPVASMVCFRYGKPAKRDYRHYNIKTVVGADDFASMQEVVHRRYKRLLEEELPLPQLIVIDGGKGQLRFARQALLDLGIADQIYIIGIAKRLEEIYFPGNQYPLHIDKRSEGLKLLQQLRNEAHRFAITFHRQKRSKHIKTELEDIKGIGPSTIELLLSTYKSVAGIKRARRNEVAALIGKKKAEVLFEGLSD